MATKNPFVKNKALKLYGSEKAAEKVAGAIAKKVKKKGK